MDMILKPIILQKIVERQDLQCAGGSFLSPLFHPLSSTFFSRVSQPRTFLERWHGDISVVATATVVI